MKVLRKNIATTSFEKGCLYSCCNITIAYTPNAQGDLFSVQLNSGQVVTELARNDVELLAIMSMRKYTMKINGVYIMDLNLPQIWYVLKQTDKFMPNNLLVLLQLFETQEYTNNGIEIQA